MFSEKINAERSVRDLVSALKNPEFLPTVQDVKILFSKGEELAKQELELPIFEVFTKEFIEAFGKYLSERVAELAKDKSDPVKILEVAAGNGRLSHLLRRELVSAQDQIEIQATDNGVQEDISQIFPVKKQDYQEALKDFQPDMVICSWMPPQKDFSAAMRRQPTVQEYIIIGPEDRDCGKPWETFGLEKYRPSGQAQPPFAKEGWSKKELSDLTKHLVPVSGRISKTISFKKN
jgi:hypothetical protein